MLMQQVIQTDVGLTTDEVRQRLLRYGINELPREPQRSLVRVALDILREPMILLLVVAGSLYLFLGDLQEALLLIASIGVVIGIELSQEQRTEHAVMALRDMSSPRALVIRDGEQSRISGRDVVPGDHMLIAEGDRVAADGVVLDATNLAVNESLLTGESLAVRKTAGSPELDMQRPGGDATSCVYSGRLIVQGHGRVVVRATGSATEMGHIGAALHAQVTSVDTFARVAPEQKLQLVQALTATGAIVAITGDGVNDAPALKATHTGIAMGGRGTDVAREAAGLVLLDDDFASIVAAIELGRRIFDNLRKAMGYDVSVHVPIAGLALIPVLLGAPLILFPVHIVFLELIIDPACSLVFEAEPAESDVMRRPPYASNELLFTRATMSVSLLQGASVLGTSLGMYLIALHWGHPADEARTLAFTTLIIANLGLIIANRSWTRLIWETLRTPNQTLWWVIGGAAIVLIGSLVLPPIHTIFHFAPLHWDDISLCLAIGFLSITWFEGFKIVRRYSSA